MRRELVRLRKKLACFALMGVVMMVFVMVLLGECRQGCAQQQDASQYGDQRFLQLVSSNVRAPVWGA